MRLALTLILLFAFAAAFAGKKKIVINENLEIMPLNKNALIHISYLHTESFGRVACNGLIYMNGNEAIFMDTPPDDSSSKKLLDWFTKQYPGVKIVAVIPEHFHEDCVGGLNEFHRRGITSYAHKETAESAAEKKFPVPQKTFGKSFELKVGEETVQCYYPGQAHTKDNIVVWIPSEKILFGGCMIKAEGAGKGNLADANEREWSNTVTKVKQSFPAVKKVVPGHGDAGGKELLDYTIKLFGN